MIKELAFPRTQQFAIEYKDGEAWKPLVAGSTIDGEKTLDFTPVTARQFRLHILKASEVPTIEEFQLFPPARQRAKSIEIGPSTIDILVFNAGSTSLKFGLFTDPACSLLISGALDWADGDRRRARLTLRTTAEMTQCRTVDIPDDAAAVQCAIRALAEVHPEGNRALADIRVVGHRVVHGGADFLDSVLIDDAIQARIARWSAVAPLHNPPALAVISAAEAALPQARHVAVFDTAYFAQLPAPRVRVPPALRLVCRLGRAAFRIPRHQPPLLCGPRGRNRGPRSGRAAHHQLPFGRRLLGGGDPQ